MIRTDPSAPVGLARPGVEVVLLDLDGVIVEANEAWSAFSEQNGGHASRTGVGVSYLQVCDAVSDPQTAEVAAAIRAAIAGELLGPVSVRIPCAEPGRSRFFDVFVSPRPGPSGQSIGATVSLAPTDDAAPEVGLGFADAPRLRALIRANAAVAGDLSLPVVLRRVVDAARELVDARYAALGLVGADGTPAEVVHSGTDEAPAHRSHERSSLEVPIRVGERVCGHLHLTGSAHGEFSSDDEQLVTALATTAGVAVDNARLHAQTEQQRRWLEASTEMTQRLFAGDSEHPMGLVLRQALAGADADVAAAVIPVDETRAGVETCLRDGRHSADVVVELASTFAGHVIRTGKPALLDDHASPFPDAARATGLGDHVGSVAGVPLAARDGTVWGALLVARRLGGPPFAEHDLPLLAAFASHAGIAVALDRARADRDKLLLLADHERIAADLHDHVIQELFATGMGLQSLVARQARPEDRQRLLDHIDAIDATIRRIRTAIFQVKHRGTDGAGLRERLITVLADLRPATGPTARIDFSGPLDTGVPPGLAEDTVAVVREAVTNVVRHAGASTVSVLVQHAGDVLTVEVEDDGVGVEGARRSSGLGNLRRRAEAHGGTLELSTPPGGGTRLRWTARTGPAS